jgi:hypothetical protein
MLIRQKRIYREDLRANPGILYLFGDNLLRVGLGGQAAEMRGEPNAVGVATKKAPGMRESDFFTDDDYDKNILGFAKDLRRAFEHAQRDGVVVLPYDGLGTGLSELPQRAPKTYRFLEDAIERLDNIGRFETTAR